MKLNELCLGALNKGWLVTILSRPLSVIKHMFNLYYHRVGTQALYTFIQCTRTKWLHISPECTTHYILSHQVESN